MDCDTLPISVHRLDHDEYTIPKSCTSHTKTKQLPGETNLELDGVG